METCLNCSKPLYRGKKYCTTQCQQDYLWSLRKAKFKETGIWEGVNHEVVVTRHTKRYIKEERGSRCEICNLTEWMGQEIPLVIDHIDGNSNNYSLDNVRLVCGNCDMQLPTYKSKNKGKGRVWRREKYRKNS